MVQEEATYSSNYEWIHKRFLLLLLLQIFILVLIGLTVGTELVWFWSAMSFVPPLVVVFHCSSKKVLLFSLLLLFVSQHLIYPLSQPDYGFSYGSDSIQDFHVASVLYDQPHFDFGQIGFGQRSEQYSEYPMVHLFAVITARVTSISLFNICRILVPLVGAVLVSYCFFVIASLIFDSCLRTAGLTTIVYGTLFYLNFKHGQFVRETFAFPLAFLSLLCFVKMQKESIASRKLKFFALFAIFSFVTFLGHHFSSYMLVGLVVLLFVYELPEKYVFPKEWILVILAIAVVFLVAFYWRSDFMFHLNATLTHIQNALSSLIGGESPFQNVMSGYPSWRIFTAIGYFAAAFFFSTIGWLAVLREEPFRRKIFFTFFIGLFLISLVLRAYAPVHSFSWGYSLAKRGTVWSFIGLSYLIVKGAAVFPKYVCLKSSLKVPLVALIVLWLGFSSFSPYPQLVTDSSIEPPITYQRYVSCVWLRDNAIHGQQLAIPSRNYDREYSDIARNMAPYAYLKEYDLTWARFEKFSGHIPVVPERKLEENISLDNLDTLYDNGEIKIVIK